MKRIFFILLSLIVTRNIEAQYITSEGSYLEGPSYISTSRIEAFRAKERYFSRINLSMDYVHMKGVGHAMDKGDYYTIQLNFFERNVGQSILLKCKNGKVIELNANSVQRDPFVQIYWTKENVIKSIANGEIVKIRIRTKNSYIDREIKNNSFSKAVSRCYNLLCSEKKKQEKREAEASKTFRSSF